MGRTLYLNENKTLRVLRDGPSIWIKWTDKAGQRVPVRLVSRVFIIGNVKLESGAITLFTENNVPVVFMNRKGDELGVAIPYNHKLPTHYEEQKVFLETNRNIERYTKWAETKRMVIQVNVLKRLFPGIGSKLRYGLGEGNYQELISRLKPSDQAKWKTITSIVGNIFRGLITEQVIKADLDPHLGVIHRRHNFGLVLDISYIMEAEIDIQSLQFLRTSIKHQYIEKKGGDYFVTESGMKNIIQRFENRKMDISNLICNIIDEIFELIRELKT